MFVPVSENKKGTHLLVILKMIRLTKPYVTSAMLEFDPPQKSR